MSYRDEMLAEVEGGKEYREESGEADVLEARYEREVSINSWYVHL